MSKIVLGLATSHSPMLLATDAELPRLVERDMKDMLPFRDEDGNRISYAEVLERADPAIAEKATAAKMLDRAAQCRAARDRLKKDLAEAKLDALIIIGDDQNEMFKASNRPSLAIFHGDKAVNAFPPDMTGMMDWLVELRSRFYSQPSKDYPMAQQLALHVIENMVEQGFDVGAVSEYPHGAGEGHAFAYVHSYIMDDAHPVPVVPVLLNTFYKPNQVTPQRALAIGKAIGKAVESMPGDLRVGVIASGGLSHFMVDEDFDAKIVKALKEKNEADLLSLHRKNYIDGTSETLNWICVHGAVGDLPVEWLEYVPGYRSPAGTGVGLAFAKWA